jgi:hypothetical protein
MTTLRHMLRAFALAALAAGPASAATLSAFDILDPRVVVQDNGKGPAETVPLFSSEVKRDQTVQGNGNGGAGHDMFLTNPSGHTIGSSNVTWGASGTTYGWTYAYDGVKASLTIGTRTIAGNAPGNSGPGNSGNGNSGNGGASGPAWNAVSFFLRATDTTRFTSSSVTVITKMANGTPLDTPLTLSVTNGQQATPWFALGTFESIFSLSGTLKFDFVRRIGATGSPNSRLGFSLNAQHVTPAEVPTPGAGLLLLGALAGLAAVRRRIVAA